MFNHLWNIHRCFETKFLRKLVFNKILSRKCNSLCNLIQLEHNPKYQTYEQIIKSSQNALRICIDSTKSWHTVDRCAKFLIFKNNL